MSTVDRFPWETLPQLTYKGIAQRRAAAAQFRGWSDTNDVGLVLSLLLRTPVLVSALALGSGYLAPLDGATAVTLELHQGETRIRALVEVDVALAVALTTHVAGEPPPALLDPTRETNPRVRGAAAAVVYAAARRVLASAGPVSVLNVAASSEALPAIFDEGDPIYATYTVLIRDEAHLARVWLAPGTFAEARATNDLRSLGRAPLSLKVVLGCEEIALSDFTALDVGDVWLIGERPRTVVLVSARGETGLTARLEGDVLRYEGEIVDVRRAFRVVEEGATLRDQVFSDVPLSVRIEVGSIEMSAQEWARLQTGDTLTLAKRLGEPVVLRVSGVEVARGELVNVEGELGVRILAKHAEHDRSVDTQVVPS